MSFIIDQNDTFFFNLRSKDQEKRLFYQKEVVGKEKLENGDFGDIFKGIDKDPNQIITLTQEQNFILLKMFLHRIYHKIAALLIVTINLKSREVSFNIKLLNERHKYLRISGKERMRLIVKYINSRCFQYFVSEYTVAISPKTGEVTIKIPSFYFLTHFDTHRLIEKLIKNVRHNFVNSISGFNNTLDMVSQVSDDLPFGHQNNQRSQMLRESFSKYYKYSQVVNTYLYICSESTHEEQFVVTHLQKEIDSIDQLKHQYVPFRQELLSVAAYQRCSLSQFDNRPCPELLIDAAERERIKSRIEMPSMQKSSNPNENCYVLNYIKTKQKIRKCLIKKICSGGFTSIYLAQIQYWYVASYNLGVPTVEEGSSTRQPHKKYVVIKREDRKALEQGRRSRIAHERFILTKIKNGLSIFLNKYYLLADNDSDFQNDLFSDYIDYPNLYDYCQRNKETMSFQTKVYFSIMIAQSLRYLSEYQIAHLDLKPTNIMTNKKLTIKLIDFGESYHPELKTHHPGFSMPYSAPQNYRLRNNYSHKNDVFSLGVIMHEMFVGKYPFYFHQQKLRDRVYRHGSYCDYWFHSSEGYAMNGQSLVLPLIQAIIVRCLHPDPDSRPELQWIVYILRGCLDYFY